MAQTGKIALFGYFGIKNLGDETVVGVILGEIRRRLPAASVFAVTLNPGGTTARHGIPAFPLRRLPGAEVSGIARALGHLAQRFDGVPLARRVVGGVRLMLLVLPEEARFLLTARRILRGTSLFVVAGSGLLRDDETSAWHHPYSTLKWSVLARLAGARVIILSVGAGPLDSVAGRLFVRCTAGLAAYCSLRSRDSLSLLRRIGAGTRARFVPDQAFMLIPAPPHRPAPVRERGFVVGINPVAYCVRHRWIVDTPGKYEHYIRRMTAFAGRLLREGHTLVFLYTQIDGDEIAGEDIRRALASGGVAGRPGQIIDEPGRSYDDLMETLSGVDLLVASRFHATVFAYLLGIPVLALSVDTRIDELMADMELPPYALPIDRPEADELMDRFHALVRERTEISRRIGEKTDSFRGQVRAQFDTVFGPRMHVSGRGGTVRTPAAHCEQQTEEEQR